MHDEPFFGNYDETYEREREREREVVKNFIMQITNKNCKKLQFIKSY